MTYYYSVNVVHDLIASARKKLQEMRGQTLTKEQLYEIFGPFDEPFNSCAEHRDAFMEILAGGLLIEYAPDKYRVAAKLDRKTEARVTAKVAEIQARIQKAAEEIRETVLSEANDVCFPSVIFIKDEKPHELPAILLTVMESQKRSLVYLSPHGIFECYVSWWRNKKLPDWNNREENSSMWIKYGEQALDAIRRHHR